MRWSALIWILCFVRGFAQTDTLLQIHKNIPIVNVTDAKAGAIGSSLVQAIDIKSNIEAGNTNLGTILSTQSDIFINKTAGTGLATAAMRGNSSEQIPITWCGKNLQSPTNGSMDLSLLPAWLFTDAQITYGPPSSLNGSGNMGGAINLLNNAFFRDTTAYNFYSAFNPFIKHEIAARMILGGEQWFNRTSIYNINAENNYSFYNRTVFGDPKQTLVNAGLTGLQLMQENSFRFNKTQILDFKYWFANTTREIPPSMTSSNDSSFQQDISHRFFICWQYCGARSAWFVREHVFYEILDYFYGLGHDHLPTHSLESNTEIENHLYLARNLQITGGFQFNNTYAKADGYNNQHDRHELALFGAIKKQLGKNIEASLSGRQSYLINGFISPVYSADLEWKIKKETHIFTQFSKSYRLPTLNDLYWNPGGNLNLLPETGYLYQLGIRLNRHISLLNFKVEGVIFSNRITNEIVWMPINTSIWTPFNIDKVWNRGANLTLTLSKDFNNVLLAFSTQESCTRANKINSMSSSPLNDNQLIYTPRLKAQSKLVVRYKSSEIFFSMNHTSRVFTDENRETYLNGYSVYETGISYLFKIRSRYYKCKPIHLDTHLTIHNLTNTRYEVLLYYPQPLQYFTFTINLII